MNSWIGRKFSKEELVARLRQVGITPDTRQMEMPVIFKISGTISKDVKLSFSDISNEFENEIVSRFKELAFESKLSGVVLFPTIVDPAEFSTPWPNYISYKKDRSVFIAENIPYELWNNSTRSEQINLLADNISSCVRKIRASTLSESDRNKLLNVIDSSRRAMHEKG